MVINLGERLSHDLFNDAFSDLKVTDDGTAVKYETLLYVVVMRPYAAINQIELRAIEGIDVQPALCSLEGGFLPMREQRVLLGTLGSIREVAAGNADPIGEMQVLESAAAATV
jgi:hypothetical protein